MDFTKERELAQECIGLQLSEFEMMQAMYPLAGEIVISKDQLNCMQNLSSLKNISKLSGFDYAINIDQYNLHIQLPILYPTKEKANIYVRSNLLSRENQLYLNNELKKYLSGLEDDTLVVGSAVSWIQEYRNNACETAKKDEDIPKELDSWEMGRFWIVSHHIYSKTKRKNMKSLAGEYQINGFCLPGKPGIICVEGTMKNISDWWQRVRSWTWQRIKNICEETHTVHTEEEQKIFYRFPAYKELTSDDIKTKSERSFNMAEFSKYLEQHDSGYVFSQLFSL